MIDRGAAGAGPGRGLGLWFMLVSLLSMQVGNSFAKELTQHMATPIGAVWVRVGFGGVILSLILLVRWLLARRAGGPAPARVVRARSAWGWAVAYGLALISMNSFFYEAISRIPVGIVVTIEFLGPLTVAILGSRRPTDFVWVGLAAAGVVILGLTPTVLTAAGVALALAAGTCWAAYILLGSKVAKHFEGIGVLTSSCVIGGIALTPLALIGGNAASLTRDSIWLGLVVALACTVLPYSVELLALKRLPTGLFAIIESLAPAVSALAAWWLLGQRLHYGDWIAIGCVVVASMGASIGAMRAGNPPSRA